MQAPRSETPRLSFWPFLIVDLTLVAGAVLIRSQSETPLSAAPLAAITACLVVGGVVLLYPFVVTHARRQEEAVAERLEQLEEVGRTVAAAAEQISIAAANLPAIAEQSARQLRAVEQMPQALQGRLAELQMQLSATAQEENAALRHELDTLRQSETGKVAAALEKISALTGDLVRFEALASRHVDSLDTATAQMPRLAEQFGRQAGDVLRVESSSAAEAVRAAGAEAVRALGVAVEEATRALETVAGRVRMDLDQMVREVPRAQAEVTADNVGTDAPDEVLAFDAVRQPADETEAVGCGAETSLAAAKVASALAEEEVGDGDAAPTMGGGVEELPAVAPDVDLEAAVMPVRLGAEPGLDVPLGQESEVALEPESAESSHVIDGTARAAAVESSTEEESVEDEPATPEPALTHDGCTRLIATAYVGLGNKLYVRGDGPGLRADKGVPLQFVSIGKWRWESAELLFPAKVKLFKNDREECVALGELTLEPGHHHEVTARF